MSSSEENGSEDSKDTSEKDCSSDANEEQPKSCKSRVPGAERFRAKKDIADSNSSSENVRRRDSKSLEQPRKKRRVSEMSGGLASPIKAWPWHGCACAANDLPPSDCENGRDMKRSLSFSDTSPRQQARSESLGALKLLHSRWKELEANKKILAESENQKREIQKLKGELDTSVKHGEKLEEKLDIRDKEIEQLKGERDTSVKHAKKLEEENEQLKEKLNTCSCGNQNGIQYAKPKREDVPHSTPQKMGFRHKLENNIKEGQRSAVHGRRRRTVSEGETAIPE